MEKETNSEKDLILETTKNGDNKVEPEVIKEKQEVKETEPNKDDKVEFDDSEDEELGDKSDDTSKTKKQSKEENHKWAEIRRAEKAKLEEEKAKEAERKKVEEQSYNKGLLAALDGKNPFTEKEIKDEDDIEELKTMQEMVKKGLDPITDFHEYVKEKKREERKQQEILKKQEEETVIKEKELEEKAINDVKEFNTKYKSINIDELLKNERFVDYSDGKLGNKSLIEIYEGFIRFEKKIEETAEEIALKKEARRQSSVGSLKGNANQEEGLLSMEQIKAMSDKEKVANIDLVNKSYQNWLATKKK